MFFAEGERDLNVTFLFIVMATQHGCVAKERIGMLIEQAAELFFYMAWIKTKRYKCSG